MEASREEEFWNALTHFIGLLGSIIGMCYLLYTNNELSTQSLSGVLFLDLDLYLFIYHQLFIIMSLNLF